MTLEFCNELARQIAEAPNLQDDIDCSSLYSDVFQKVGNTSMVDCQNGFDSRYEVPASRGGKYVTLSDLRNIFHIGIEHGKKKIAGWRARWDEEFCNAIGGYPIGSILRTQSGIRMISRVGDNKTKVPEDGKTISEWKRCEPTALFGDDYYRYRNGISIIGELPIRPVTESRLIATYHCEQSQLAIFTYQYLCATPRGAVAMSLCKNGNNDSSMRLKMSQYPDIYTNEEHSDDYIELLCHQVVRPDESWPHWLKTWMDFRSPHKVVPLKAGVTYYFFIEYENGCANTNNWAGEINWRTAKLLYHSIYRKLAWPRI